jgi:hypothetical protein
MTANLSLLCRTAAFICLVIAIDLPKTVRNVEVVKVGICFLAGVFWTLAEYFGGIKR